MKFIKIYIAVFTAVVLINSPVFADEVPVASKPSNVFTESKQSIVVDASHPEFIIKLKSNPSTGYSWFLREYDKDLITPVKHLFEKPIEKLMGAPGFEVWTFRAKAAAFTIPQQTTIRLVYARPWQSDDGTQIVFRVSTQKNETAKH